MNVLGAEHESQKKFQSLPLKNLSNALYLNIEQKLLLLIENYYLQKCI